MVRNLKKTKQRGERDTVNLRVRHGECWGVTHDESTSEIRCVCERHNVNCVINYVIPLKHGS